MYMHCYFERQWVVKLFGKGYSKGLFQVIEPAFYSYAES